MPPMAELTEYRIKPRLAPGLFVFEKASRTTEWIKDWHGGPPITFSNITNGGSFTIASIDIRPAKKAKSRKGEKAESANNRSSSQIRTQSHFMLHQISLYAPPISLYAPPISLYERTHILLEPSNVRVFSC